MTVHCKAILQAVLILPSNYNLSTQANRRNFSFQTIKNCLCRHSINALSMLKMFLYTKKSNFQTIILWFFLPFILLDCGCNQNREQTVFTENANEKLEKVCRKMPRSTVYTDYYEESELHLSKQPNLLNMALIPEGQYYVGTNEPHFEADQESPERKVSVKAFLLDKYEVSNADFQKFVEESNYKTEAEIFEDSFLFKNLLSPEMQKEYENFRVVNALWWFKVRGVNWKQPFGPRSNLSGYENHPVVHVSWNDAYKFCKHQGKRLPTETEWEIACRGGKRGRLFPWGNKFMPKDKHWLNIWQGKFPDNNTLEDGYDTTCPVDKFRQNSLDLYNMVGNVWEWTQDLWNARDTGSSPSRVKKGGSYLCHKSYCYRYRCAARSQNTADSSAGNLGFRCAKDL